MWLATGIIPGTDPALPTTNLPRCLRRFHRRRAGLLPDAGRSNRAGRRVLVRFWLGSGGYVSTGVHMPRAYADAPHLLPDAELRDQPKARAGVHLP